jgi:pepF/M3 family oligoendopeptidase
MSETELLEKPTRWNLANIYSSLAGDDYTAARQQLDDGLTALEATFDSVGVRRLPAAPTLAPAMLAEQLHHVLAQVNDLWRLAETLDSFVHGYVTTDSYDALAQREASKLELLDTRRQKLAVRLTGWIGSLAPRIDELTAIDPTLADHGYFLRHTAQQSRYLMSEELESLAADLAVDGGLAFGKLQGNVTSQLKVPLEHDGKVEELPITVVHNLCFDRDPQVRERAYHAELAGWHSVRTTVAACLNGVKGTALTLARRRGRNEVLEVALDDNRIDRPTLEALLGAIRENFPMFRGYLRSKARKLGRQTLPWWDLFAPLGASHLTFTWTAARDFLQDKFSQFAPELGDYAARAFDQRWIDGQPRDGKRGGAFCMPVVGVEESRILANFDGSYEQLGTLAHELGHGYHNHCQMGLEPLRRGAPSTLAETASIFCETLIAEATLPTASPEEQLMILEAQLSGATQVCLDISSRFLFESALFERRQSSELSADDLCELMLAAQRETYADAVEEATYHRYMWLWKPHYYAHSQNFYNFPYAFGHLFALGLYAIYRREGASFVPRYRQLLRLTGQYDAAPLAAEFGIDITTRDFWRQSLAVIAQQARRYDELKAV